MTAKSTSTTRQSSFGKFDIKNRRGIASRSCYASIVYYHYKDQNLADGTTTKRERSTTNVSNSPVKGTLEQEIASVRISKSLQSTSTFTVSLLPNKNWKQFISPGDWMLIYIFDNSGSKNKFDTQGFQDTKNMVMMANVDRVSRSLQKDQETDKTLLRYTVSGRGIGKVFENTDVWFNPYLFTQNELDVVLRDAGLQILGDPSTMTRLLLDTFLGPGGQFKAGKTSDLKMWQIPFDLANAISSSGVTSPPKFYDILKKEIEPGLPGFKKRQMLTVNSNGSLLDLLQRSSNHLVNELYFEDVRSDNGDVSPTIVLKPRPVQTPNFAAKGVGSGINNKFKSLQDLGKENFVEILPSEVLFEDLGKDDHSKFNLWWMNTDLSFEGIYSAQANLNNDSGASNPLLVTNSIKRDGLRRFEQLMDFCYAKAEGVSGTPDIKLFQGFMEQLYDLHAFNHLYDSGTMECTGILEAELGKALIVKGDPSKPQTPSKIYFIEGYEHQWTFPSTWRTTFTLSHGQWFTTGKNIFIDIEPASGGQLDQSFSSTYVAQTFAGKK